MRAVGQIKTRLLKVKSHTGIANNEQADAAAGRVARRDTPTDAEWQVEASDNNPGAKHLWIPKADGAERNAGHFANDLYRGVPSLMKPEVHLVYTKQTLYISFMASAVPQLDLRSSTMTLNR